MSEETRIEKVGREAVDPDRLLEGEDPHTGYPEDAAHWLRVYEDLLRFKQNLLRRANEVLPAMEPAAQKEVDETDLTILAAEAARLQRRRDFWRGRVTALGGPGAS